MNRKLAYVAFTAAALTTGFSLPSCPGQEALQQQVDTASATAAELKKQVQGLETKLKTMETELTTTKTAVVQLNETVNKQTEAMTALQTQVTEQTAKIAALSAPKPAARTRSTTTYRRR